MLTRLQWSGVVVGFSALSGWYGFMFGRESARKELDAKINELKATVQTLKDTPN